LTAARTHARTVRGRLMMMVSSSSVFVNRLPPQCSLAPEGREKLQFKDFLFWRGKTDAYNAAGAAIEGVAATWLSPEIELMSALSVMVTLHAAAGSGSANAPKYTSSGVA
jgi:hypothetical protein